MRTFAVSRPPSFFATGLVALDVLQAPSDSEGVRYRAGGTAGNVAAILGALGWTSTLIGPSEESAAYSLMCADLMRCNVRYHGLIGAAVPVIVQELSATSEHKFLFNCPQCGQALPRFSRSQMWATAHVDDVDVFFADRVSDDVLKLAQQARRNGAFVVYEPSDPADAPWLDEMLSIADMVKCSSERAARLPSLEHGDYLTVQTLGARGVRWRWERYGQADWQTLAATQLQRVVDTCGAGDWLTSGILMGLSRRGFTRDRRPGKAIFQILDRAQRLAAWSCGFAGARGALYEAGPAAAIASMAKPSPSLWEWDPLPEANEAHLHCAVCPL